MKINELKAILEEKKLDFAMFYTLDSAKANPNMLYFSGYSGIGALIIPKKQNPFIIAPEMEFEKAGQSKIKVFPMEKKMFFESISSIIRKNKVRSKRIAIDYNNFTLNTYKYFKKQFKNIKAKDISLECLKLRQIKTDKEIKIIRKSCNYTSTILKKTINNFGDFKTEAEASAFLNYEAHKLGLVAAFEPIVASGSNGSIPHYVPKNTRLKGGFCFIDFGVKYRGYCSDITRTIYLGGISKKEREIYNFLLKIQQGVIDSIRVNDRCGKIYDRCGKSLKEYSRYFIHGLGHGVGLEIHESPSLSLNSNDKIAENMAFTIEPGIYMPKKFGIRIEDTVLMQKNARILTNVTKDLLII